MESKDFFDFDIAIDFYDMVQYQKMFLKNIRYTATCFGMAGVYVILVLIDFLITRNTMNFIFIGVALLITVFSIAYSYFANTIRKAQKIACSDKFCQRKTNIIVEEFYVEVIIKSEEDGLFFSRVFPYPLISTVLENDRYIAFSAAVDKQIIIPKRYMEPYQKTKLINLLKENNKLYARVKD
jgi:hypothetical protein